MPEYGSFEYALRMSEYAAKHSGILWAVWLTDQGLYLDWPYTPLADRKWYTPGLKMVCITRPDFEWYCRMKLEPVFKW